LLDFFVQRSVGRLARLVNALTSFPASLPATVIAIAFLVSLGVGERSLSGTYWLLFLAYLVLLLPQASRAAGAALSQLGRDVWEASLMSGAGPLRTFGLILLPLMRSGLIAGWVIVFIGALAETSAGAFLTSSKTPVVGPVILDVWQNGGTYPQLATLTLLVTLIQTAVVLLVLVFSRGAFRHHGG
jgi:iron(III) transport system permease protein